MIGNYPRPADDTMMVRSRWSKIRAYPDSVLVEGFHAIKHAIRFGADIRIVICSNPEAVRQLARSHAADVAQTVERLIDVIDRKTFKDLTGSIHPTEIAALATKAHHEEKELASGPREAPLVLLENPRSLGNFGAVIRVAAGFDVTGVISTGDVDPWHTNVIRGAAGLHYALPVAPISSLDLIQGPIIAFDAEGIDSTLIDIPDNAILAFGSERHGISDALRARVDVLAAIPMRPGVSSYNLTTSVAMALYQWVLRSKTG